MILQTSWEQIRQKGEELTFEYQKGDITDKLGTNPTKKGEIEIGYYRGDITDKLGTNPTKKGGVHVSA